MQEIIEDINDIEYMKDWKEVKLGDVVESISERFISKKEKIVLINTSDVLEGKVLNHKYEPNENLKGQFKKSFKSGDILYSEIRPQNKRFGYVDFDSEDYVASTKLMVLRKKNDEIDNLFLFQILKSDKLINNLQQLAETRSGTFPQITYTELANIYTNLPPLPTQQKIAQILSSLDDKIELNNAINKNLEEIAQTLFKQWFVDFEFPNENGEPYKSSGGEMMESELGMIPKGWRVEKANDLFSVKDGTHDSPKKSENGFYLITSKNIKNNEIDFLTANKISEEDYNKINFRSKVEKNDILISMIGTVGLTLLVMEDEVKFAIKNIGLFKTSEMNDFYSYFYYYLNTQVMKDYILSHLAGSTQQYISLTELRNIPVLLPNDFLLKEFISTSKSILSKIKGNQTETQTLTKLRDELLPKLMSGEVRV